MAHREGPEREYMYSCTRSLTLRLDEGLVVNATLWPLYPQGKTSYQLYRRLVGSFF